MNNKKLKGVEFVAIWFFILNLGFRLLFLYWNNAESTDGVEYMAYHFFSDVQRTPFYPYLIKIVHFFGPSLQTSGRLVSILMASLCVFPIFYIAKAVFNKRAAIYSCLFFIVSPVVFRNSISVMSDSTHLFFFLCAIYYGWKSFLYYHKKDIALFVFISGIATMIRPESLMFVPLLLILFFISCQKLKPIKTIYLFFASGISWYAFLAQTFLRAIIMHSSGYFGLYKWGVATTTLTRFFNFFTAYLKALPFVIVYPVFFIIYFWNMGYPKTKATGC